MSAAKTDIHYVLQNSAANKTLYSFWLIIPKVERRSKLEITKRDNEINKCFLKQFFWALKWVRIQQPGNLLPQAAEGGLKESTPMKPTNRYELATEQNRMITGQPAWAQLVWNKRTNLKPQNAI